MAVETRLRWIERTLAVAAVVCLGWYAGVAVELRTYQARQQAALEQALAERPLAPVEDAPVAAPQSENRAAVGRIEIARLHLAAMVAEGTDAATLRVAAGHVTGTPPPWEDGNTAVAGHRDTLFRELRNISINDEIRFVTRRGAFRYVVREILVVDPDAMWVLAPTRHARLTLVTCYPFDAIGPAPHRYVVRADRVGEAAH